MQLSSVKRTERAFASDNRRAGELRASRLCNFPFMQFLCINLKSGIDNINDFIYNQVGGDKLSEATTIKVLCVKLNISVSELARRNGTSPQAFNQKMKRDGFTPAELHAIAESVGCKYESAFILPNGERLADQFSITEKGGNNVSNPIKSRENSARRKLARQGYLLRKSRAQSTSINDYGGYMIVDARTSTIEAGERFDLSLEDVESFAEEE